VAICSPGRGRSALPLGQRVGSRCGSGARQVTEYARSRSGKRTCQGSQSVGRHGHGRKRPAMDGRIRRSAYSRRYSARQQLLPAAGFHLVLPQACRLSEHGKLLLMSPSMDRSGTGDSAACAMPGKFSPLSRVQESQEFTARRCVPSLRSRWSPIQDHRRRFQPRSRCRFHNDKYCRQFVYSAGKVVER